MENFETFQKTIGDISEMIMKCVIVMFYSSDISRRINGKYYLYFSDESDNTIKLLVIYVFICFSLMVPVLFYIRFEIIGNSWLLLDSSDYIINCTLESHSRIC